jgi:hypothetical protein
MKRRVEAGHLGKIGKAAMKGLGQQNLLGQVFGIEGTEPLRSIIPSRIRCSPSPASNRANLMLDEPPLIVRMRGGMRGFAA